MIGARDGEGGGRAGSGQGAEHTGAQGEAKVIGARGGERVGRARSGQGAEHTGAQGEAKVIGARLGEGVGRKRVKDVLGTPPPAGRRTLKQSWVRVPSCMLAGIARGVITRASASRACRTVPTTKPGV